MMETFSSGLPKLKRPPLINSGIWLNEFGFECVADSVYTVLLLSLHQCINTTHNPDFMNVGFMITLVAFHQ